MRNPSKKYETTNYFSELNNLLLYGLPLLYNYKVLTDYIILCNSADLANGTNH